MSFGRCLVLNADYSLIHVTPDWLDALILVIKDKVRALSFYDRPARSEGGTSMQVPSVAVLKRYVRVGRRRPSFSFPSKRNILIRDGFKCAYCGCGLTMGTCTRDHVIPTSRGGEDTLLNVVAACSGCNNLKSDLTPAEAGLKLRVQPRHLTDEEKLEVLVKTHRSHERSAWLSFLKENGVALS